MCKINLSDNLSLEELPVKFGNKITYGANVFTTERINVKNGIGFVSHIPTSHNGNKSIFGWVAVDANKQLFKRVKFNNNCFKFKKNFKKFNGDIEINYCYYDNDAKSIEILACDIALDRV